MCVCIKNGKGPVGGMLGLGQRDGVAYKRITPNIRQNKRTFFVFTSFSLFSSLAVLPVAFLALLHFGTFQHLSLSPIITHLAKVVTCEKQMGKKIIQVYATHTLSFTTRAL